MAEIFLYAHDAGINPQQLQKLRRSDYIPVGVRYLSDAKLLEAPPPLSQARVDLLLVAACRAVLKGTDWAKQEFASEVAKAIIAAAEKADG